MSLNLLLFHLILLPPDIKMEISVHQPTVLIGDGGK